MHNLAGHVPAQAPPLLLSVFTGSWILKPGTLLVPRSALGLSLPLVLVPFLRQSPNNKHTREFSSY